MSTHTAQINLSVLHAEEFTAAEVPSAGSVGERTLRSGRGNVLGVSLSGSTTPAVTKPMISRTVTIAGTVSLDLTAIAAAVIPPSATRTVDMTGAKLVGYTLRAKSTNVAAINVAPGGASPYPLFGTGNDVDVQPGEQIAACFRDVASSKPAVAAGVKNIDISGTNDDVLYIDLLFGT